MVLLLAACRPDDRHPPEPEETATHTGVPWDLPSCRVPADNALRVECRFEGSVARLTLAGTDGTDRTWTNTAPGRVTGVTLRAESDYRATLVVDGAVAVDETLRTGALPTPVDLRFVVDVDGTSRVDHLLFPFTCGGAPHLVVTDADGRVVWYQGTGLTGALTGFDSTDRGSVIALVGRSFVREYAWDGTPGLAWDRDPDTDPWLHHALDVRGDRVVALDIRERQWPDGITYLDDGVAELTAAGATNVWRMSDVLDPQGRHGFAPPYWSTVFPDATDAFHTNAVELMSDGGFLVTAKHLDSVFRVNADGSLRWALGGSRWAMDYGPVALTAVGDASFEFPHHANLTPSGTLLVFDNGRDFSVSNVVELAIDEAARTATLVRRWSLGGPCPIQGAAFGLPDGTVVATCATRREIYELDDGGVHRKVHLACGGSLADPSAVLVRAKPIPRP